MNTCPNCGKVAGLQSSILQGCMCQYSMQAPPQRTERPVDCERCNRLEEQAYDLVGKLRVANIKLSMQPQRTWVGLTESERRLINFQWQDGNGTAPEIIDLVEAKLKQKNGYAEEKNNA
jgi:hypothetical protein